MRIVSLLALSAAVSFLGGCSSPEKQAIEKAEGLVKAQLKDPWSAKFADEYVGDPELHYPVCGRVNAKNSFGGYTGFRRFYVSGSDGKASVEPETPEEDPTFAVFWDGVCQNGGRTPV